jgi:hypothetical protein
MSPVLIGILASVSFASDPYLELGVTALDLGEKVVFDVRGAAPGQKVVFLRGSAYGEGPCPASIAPACLQILEPISSLGSAIADADGHAKLKVVLPDVPVGTAVAVQAVTKAPDVRLSEAQERLVRDFGATDPYGIGATYQPVDDTFMRPDLLIADTIGIAEPVTVTGFDCQGRTLGGFYRAALYTDLAFHPDQLVAESPATPVNVGSNPSVNLTAPVVLDPGRYWLAVVYQGIVDTWENGLLPESPEYVTIHTFNLPMPDPLLAGALTAGPRLACSVTVQ